jgi:uncharacterized protein YacL
MNTLYVLLVFVILLQVLNLYLTNKPKQNLAPTVKDKIKPSSIIVDTCALIDGRIQDILNTGFIREHLYVPRRVIEELQFLADNGDAHKRSRARYGLDVVQKLQDTSKDQVSVLEDEYKNDTEVDEVLVRLAKKHNAMLYTTDYNLNKVAKIYGVLVLNVNELMHAIRPIRLPGEFVTVKIVQKGETSSQGVGYLEDGTMAVIENAARKIGQMVTAEVERMLQTEAGKMIFARLKNNKNSNISRYKRPKQK